MTTSPRVKLDNPPSAPPPAGSYSHVARLEFGEGALIIVSGQVAVADNGQLIGSDSMREQSERVFQILAAILASHNATFDEVVNLRTYLTDIDRIDEYAAVRRRHLGNRPPTSTTVEVSRLVMPRALVEVDLMAWSNRSAHDG